MLLLDIIKTKVETNYHRGKHKKFQDIGPVPKEFEAYFDTLNRDGIIVIENFLTVEQCKEIRKEIDSLMEKYDDKLWKDAKESDYRIYGVENVSEKIKEFSTNKSIKTLGENYLKTQIKRTMTLAGKLNFKEGNLGSGGGWHRDSVNINEFKSIVYLSDVDEDNGPFTFVLGSHTDENVISTIKNCGIKHRQNRFTDEEVKGIVDKLNLEMKTYTAKAGTMIIVDTRGIHIGTPIKKGVRYALTNYFSPLSMYDKMIGHAQKVMLKP